MSLFTDIVKSAIGTDDSSGQVENKTQNLLSGSLGMLEKMGGIDGLVKKFQQSGMGDIAESWVGTGENRSINPDQLTNALGKDQVDAVAQQADIPKSQGASVLSQILPAMVDKLTPEGKPPESSNLATWGKVLLGGAGAALAAKAAASYFGKDEDEESNRPTQDNKQQPQAPQQLIPELDRPLRRPFELTLYPAAIRFLKLPNSSITIAINGSAFLMRIGIF